MNRRYLRQGAAALAGAILLPTFALAANEPQPFSYDALVERARSMANTAYQPPALPAPEVVQQIDYARHGELVFDTQRAPFSGQPDTEASEGYPLVFFPLGKYAPKGVHMFMVDQGEAVEIPYSADFFDMPADNPARQLPADAGFAGFRLQEWHTAEDWVKQDWVAFQGASYFRSIGADGQYGQSARGIAIDPAVAGKPEEFPDFTEFYIEQQDDATPDTPVTVHALLNGPSVTGAYRFKMTRGLDRTTPVVMDVEARIFLREDVDRLGLLPLTSMFWFGEYGAERLKDWRPEVHDSDGLAMWTGSGERIWRPLNNPPRTMANSFYTPGVKGFGLMQRERSFDEYQDDGVFYEKRASAWIQPKGDWGDGSVTLVELSTDDEIHDNIVAMWTPTGPAGKGREYNVGYRLTWFEDNPVPPNAARFLATRIGAGGIPGQPRPEGVVKIVCDFENHGFEELTRDPGIRPVVTASRGTVGGFAAYPVVDEDYWRAIFDLDFSSIPEDDDTPIDLRMFVEVDGESRTETWLMQLFPSQMRTLLASRP